MARACSTAPDRCRMARVHWARPSPRHQAEHHGQERGNLAQGVSGLIRLAGPQDPGKFSAESDAHSDS